jgi:AcrR family transcriptional regulator
MTTPHGRDAVRSALIETATRLFAERGPSGVGVREIAREAGVNHGLIHRHFGSKDGLLQAVMQQLSSRASADLGQPVADERLRDLLTSLLDRSSAAQFHWRILARAMLDGQSPESLQDRFPVYERLLEVIRKRNPQHMSPEALTSMIMATGLGMLVFGPWIRAATGQDDAQWKATSRQILGGFATTSSNR